MHPKRSYVGWLIGVMVLGVLALKPSLVFSAVEGLDPEVEYNLTYQTGANSAQMLERVKITDVIEIRSKRFLVVYLGGYKTRGYVDLESVRSILPTVR